MSDLSCCGTKCNECYCYGKMCNGCNASEGKVFHAPEAKACPIYECAILERHLKNCAECKEVPCGIWMETRDPKFTDEEFEQSVAMRVQALKECGGTDSE